MIARVAVFLPLQGHFDYDVPTPIAAAVATGARVWVPWRRRAVEGVIVALDPPDSPSERKPLSKLVAAPPIAADLLELAAWMAEYYMAPPGEVLRLFLPSGGGVRARNEVTLTAQGTQALSQLQGALLPVELAQLGKKSRLLLVALSNQDKRAIAEATSNDALTELTELGLVSQGDEIETPKLRSEICLRATRAPTTEEFSRSPKRAEVYEQIAKAKEIRLAELRATFPNASDIVATLARANLVEKFDRECAPKVDVDPFEVAVQNQPPPTLTAAQTRALSAVDSALAENRTLPILLHGITGSGKTEVYLRAIERVRALGKTALVLVPEISLTPQLGARFRARFGDKVAILHSGLAPWQRQHAFERLRRGDAAIALGARSAVFAPLANLGMVVVDEEHDSSFKQEDGVRYHGRDVALRRARAARAVAIVGSATPSVEAYAAAKSGRMQLIELPERPTAQALPTVEVIDLKKHQTQDGLLSAALVAALRETLAAKEQSILFLNRRGFSAFVLCKSCGVKIGCPHCSVTLTYHQREQRLLCHYCGHARALPRKCEACSSPAITRLGYGTEQLEEVVRATFPQAKVVRFDRDTTQGDDLRKLLSTIRNREADIVVGTQMVAKGHDFPFVTLVGVVLADHGMGLPDFRASERTFQLLEQVAGRAGRGDRPGRVIVQTYSPTHPAVECATAHDYQRFFSLELAARQELSYPPAARMACIRVDGSQSAQVRSASERAASEARKTAATLSPTDRADILGPAEAPLGRLKGRVRWQLFLRAATATSLRALARSGLSVKGEGDVRLSVDIDPVSML